MAEEMTPDLTARMWRPRFMSLMTLSSLVAQDLELRAKDGTTRVERIEYLDALMSTQTGERYPTKPTEKAEFASRGLPPQNQTGLQAYILRELLGLEADFVFLVEDASATSKTHRTLTWRETFDALDTSMCPHFMQQWIRRLGIGNQLRRDPS